MNVDDVYFDYIYNQGEDIFNINFPMILFIHSGELIIQQENENLTITKGESVFFCHGVKACVYKKNCGEELFCGIYIGFSQTVLSEFAVITHYKNQYKKRSVASHVVRLPCLPCIQSLYISMAIYLEWGVKPSEYIIRLKQEEGIFSLLLIDQEFRKILFDFVEKEQKAAYLL